MKKFRIKKSTYILFLVVILCYACKNKSNVKSDVNQLTESSELLEKEISKNTVDLSLEESNQEQMDKKESDEEVIIIKNEDDKKYDDEIIERISNYPNVDGSTANIPLMAQIMADYTGISLEDAENKISVSKTDSAWESLLEIGNTIDVNNELIIAYEPSKDMKEYINKSKNKLIINPIGVDALVFLRNKNNRVKNLTLENLQNIYAGKILNWKELGGDDIKIEAYQRVYNSGSQTLFLKKVMKDVKPVVAKKEYELREMGGVFTTLSSYDNTANAIGYSVYYYADKMLDYPNLDFFSVDNVYPTDETISNGEYPFLNEFYVAIREDAEEDSPARKLYNFILSDEGKSSLTKASYIPSKNNDRISFIK